MFSFNSLGGERKSLLAIVIVFTGVTIAPWLSVKICKKFIVNVIESSIYLNLSAATLADVNSPELVYTGWGDICHSDRDITSTSATLNQAFFSINTVKTKDG